MFWCILERNYITSI